MITQSDPFIASEDQPGAKAAHSQQQMGVVMELFLLKTAKKGRLVSDRNEQKVTDQAEEERSFTNGCENITLPGL